MAAKPTKESNQGLVITLVFFILASIGLGVATYYGFADQKKLIDDAKKHQLTAKRADDERDFYRFQSTLLRAYLGYPPEDTKLMENLASDKSKFAGGQFGSGLSEDRKKELEELRKIVAENIEKPGKAGTWDADKKAPEKTYEQLLTEERDRVAKLQESLRNADAEVAKARAAQKNAENNLTTAKMEFDAQLKQLADDHQKQIASYKNQMENFKKEFDRISKAKDPTANQLLAEREQALKDKNAMIKEMKDQREKIAALESRLSRYQEDKPIDLKVRGSIVSLHSSGTRAYIDLGSAHGLKPQTTFAVYGLGPNGKPKSKPKGSVEVVNVVRDRLAEVVITAMYNPYDEGDIVTGRRKALGVTDPGNTDPIVKGDVLINPAWNPDAKTHIAIAGVIDLTGQGFDSVDAFMRALEKQNVIVDAYLDPKDYSLKGEGIGQRTDYLIIGDQPYSSDPGGKTTKAETIQKGIDTLQAQARKYGVATVKLSKFLEETGYRLNRRVED